MPFLVLLAPPALGSAPEPRPTATASAVVTATPSASPTATPAAGTATPASPAVAKPAATVVSFTFGGTHRSQADAASILAEHSMAGTFYINSGYIDYPAYLSLDQVRSIARNRSEVAGASLYGNDLTRLSVREASEEICNDRSTLAQLGFQVTSFAYPYGAHSKDVEKAVRNCGYNSARDVAGLYVSPEMCSLCPVGESLPPKSDYLLRTAASTEVSELQAMVLRAEAVGGTWLPLEFTNVCVCPAAPDGYITPSDFTDFVTWLGQRPETTVVMTVDQVIGGPLLPVHGTPLKRLVPEPSPALSTPQALSKVPAWTVLGIGIGQKQIILVGVLLSVAIVVTFRLASRGSRYVH